MTHLQLGEALSPAGVSLIYHTVLTIALCVDPVVSPFIDEQACFRGGPGPRTFSSDLTHEDENPGPVASSLRLLA